MTKVEIRMTNGSDGGRWLSELFRDEVIQRGFSWSKGQHHEADDQKDEGGLIDHESNRIAQPVNVVVGCRKMGC